MFFDAILHFWDNSVQKLSLIATTRRLAAPLFISDTDRRAEHTLQLESSICANNFHLPHVQAARNKPRGQRERKNVHKFSKTNFTLLIPRKFLQSVRQPTNALNKIQLMRSIKSLHDSVGGCHPERAFKNKGIQIQHANRDTALPA
jgi:hypothetical protein